jgi:hypothetical protein
MIIIYQLSQILDDSNTYRTLFCMYSTSWIPILVEWLWSKKGTKPYCDGIDAIDRHADIQYLFWYNDSTGIENRDVENMQNRVMYIFDTLDSNSTSGVENGVCAERKKYMIRTKDRRQTDRCYYLVIPSHLGLEQV